MDSKFEHKIFGTLKYDAKMEWYVGSFNFNNNPIDICVPAEDDNCFQACLLQLERIYNQLENIDKSAKEFAVKELLEEKNGEWLADGESKISEEEFISRISLESIIIGNGQSSEFFYDDDGLFFDHAVLLTRHNDGLWLDAEIAD